MPPTPPAPPSPPAPVPGGGTLLGANQLQQSINTLNTSVQNLTTALGNMNNNNGSGSSNGPGGGTAQAGGNGGGFPRMFNPFRNSSGQNQGTLGGGGAGGAGNVAPVRSFSSLGSLAGPAMVASAITSFGQQQMAPLLTLNQYATTSMNGMSMNGMSRGQAFQAMYNQAGFNPRNPNYLALSNIDAITSMQPLQQRAGSMIIGNTAIGRATVAAQSGFHFANPTLGATTSAQMASALYSPTMSLNAMSLGYKPFLSSKPGGAPMNPAQIAQSILTGMGLKGLSGNKLYGNLASGKGQADLSYLFGSQGIDNTTAAQFLNEYATLASKGLNTKQASNLVAKAATNRAAQSQLGKYGIYTATNDIQNLANNQATVTAREGTYAQSFDAGLRQATSLLTEFNKVLTSILQHTGLSSILGYGGGMGGVLSGANHALGTLGTIGAYTMGKGLAGRIFGGAATTAAGSAGAGALGTAATMTGAVGLGLGLGSAGVVAYNRYAPSLMKSLGIHNLFGLGGSNNSGQISQEIAAVQKANIPASTKAHLLHLLTMQGQGGGTLSTATQNQISAIASPKAGATTGVGGGGSTTTQSKTGGNNMSAISGSAKKAVSAAESQLGVPYAWGVESPGVGFDCSALVQWAYKQAGVNIPRTSQAQWSALSKRAIPLGSVQEGDLVFTAGSDGTPNSPGHVGMMIDSKHLIQAPQTGQDVQIVPYDPKGWTHAARPSGSGSFVAGSVASVSGGTGAVAGNRGIAGGNGGAYGSANEVDVISAMGGGGFGFSRGVVSGSGSKTGNGSSGSTGKGNANVSTSGGGTPAANRLLGQKLAQQMYGWTGKEWSSLDSLWGTYESGWNNNALNNGPNTAAYGIAQFEPATWATVGGTRTSNPGLQIKYGLEYIKKIYGDPVGALNFELSHTPHWYGAGGTTLPGLSVVGDRGPELMFSGGGDKVFSNAQTMQLINSIKGSAPAQSPWKTDITSGQRSSASSSGMLNVTFNQGSIVINGSGNSTKDASNAGREVARQVVRHLHDESVHQAIRSGEKM